VLLSASRYFLRGSGMPNMMAFPEPSGISWTIFALPLSLARKYYEMRQIEMLPKKADASFRKL
jgi:hypothetical protein